MEKLTRSGAKPQNPDERPSRWPNFFGLVMAVFLFSAAPAAAHYVYQDDRVYNGDNECVEVRSEVSHGSLGAGYYKTDVEVWQGLLGYGNCLYHWERSSGKIAGKQQHFVNNNGSSRVCTATGWVFNTSFGNQLTIAVNHNRDYPLCGDGHYANWTGGYNNNGGEWHGGWVWSGWHWFD